MGWRVRHPLVALSYLIRRQIPRALLRERRWPGIFLSGSDEGPTAA